MDRKLENPKDSNVYRKSFAEFDTTPSGSHPSSAVSFFKHQIPSGLFLKSMEAEIQKGLAEFKKLM